MVSLEDSYNDRLLNVKFTREELKPYEILDFDNTEICSVNECNNKASGIIRCKSVCTKCYKKIRRDNKKRLIKGIDIPSNDLSFL